MADQNENAPRPKGNRPAENAIQATPASLLASMNWQGNDAAQDFLGLNEAPPAAAQPAAAVPRAPKVAKAVGDESWLMDEGAAEPAQPIAAEHDDAQSEHAQDADSAELDDADGKQDAGERRGSPRSPAVLDASWTEPTAARGKSKAPLVAAAVGLAVLGAAGFFFAQSRSGAKPDVARASNEPAPAPVEAKPASAVKPDAGSRKAGRTAPSSRTALDRSGQAIAVTTPEADALAADVSSEAPVADGGAAVNPPTLAAGYEPKDAPIVDGSGDMALAGIGSSVAAAGGSTPAAAPKFEPKPSATSARHAATNASRAERAFAGLPTGMELASSGKPEPASEAFPWIRSESFDPASDDSQSNPEEGERLTAPNESPEPEAPIVATPEASSPPVASPASDVAAAVQPSKPSRPRVRVIGSASTQLSDAKADRPRNDVAIAGVPTTPPPMEPSPGDRPVDSGANAPVAPVATGGDAPPAVEVREGVVPPRDVLLPGAANNGVRVAGVKDLQSVWDGDSVPMDRIDAKTKVLTPNVGNVRVKLKTKDVFEGRLYAVGENSVWLEGSFGRMGLDHARIAEIERLGGDTASAGAAKGGEVAAASDRVRVKTPGGLVFGKVVSRDDTKATVVTDAGLRLTVDAKDVEAVTTAPKLVIKQATPTKN